MQYDFHSIPDRSMYGSSKWNAVPGASVKCVPLSTADMEFPTAPEIVNVLQQYTQDAILGYTDPTESFYHAVCSFMKRRHNYEVRPEEIICTPGVVYALGMLIDAMSNPGDGVIVISPVYYPFDLSVLARGRTILYNELLLEGDRYSIDYDRLEELASRADAKVLLFCNPHNPVGRVWGIGELEKVVDICARHNVFIVDDEIHHDLIMPGYKHTVMATLSETARQICAVCTAPSKTFNLAGVQCSNIIIADPVVRAKARAVHMMNLVSHQNTFSYKACEAAYELCDEWLEQLLEVIAGNAKYIDTFMKEHFPEIKVFPLEGTYLLWLDMRSLGMTHKELEHFMQKEAKLYLDEGYIFGPSGRGFERINLACSRTTLEASMQRFSEAMTVLKNRWEMEGRPYHKTLEKGDKIIGFIYDTPEKTGLDLSENMEKPTILVFSRYYSCPICQMMLGQLRGMWPKLQESGFDLKVVLQSERKNVAEACKENPFPFDLICDPDAKLYDRYNVFEADTLPQLSGGSSQLLESIGGVQKLLLPTFLGEKSEGRSQQLPALFIVMPDSTVAYAHYGSHIADLPDFESLKEVI